MELKGLKTLIENKQKVEFPLIFNCEDSDFVAKQYLKEISSYMKLSFEIVEDLSEIPANGLFGFEDTNYYLYKCDKLKEIPKLNAHTVVIAFSVSKEVRDALESYIVDVPSLQDWQLEEYVNCSCEGLKPDDIKWILKISHLDPYRVEVEIDKLRIFPPLTRHTLFEEFKNQGVFETAAEFNIFNLSNALQSKDLETIKKILIDAKYVDLEPTGLITITYKNLKNLIKVWCSRNPTPENTGLKSNQIWAINKAPRTYTNSQLVNAFKLVASLDRKIKEGNFPVELTVDYIVIKLLSGV